MLESLQLAINRSVARKITDVAFRNPSFVGLLFGLDHYYSSKSDELRYNTDGLSGGRMRFLYETQLPEWQAAQVLNEDPESARSRMSKKYNLKQGTLAPTAKEIAEAVEKYDANRLANDPDIQVPYVKKVADAVVKAWILEVQKDLFPATNVLGGTSGGVNPGNRGSLPAITYFLQTGFANNDATGTGTYLLYPDLDINASGSNGLKAINWGSTGSGVTLSARGVLENLLMPIRSNGGNPDVILCHRAAYAFLKSQLASSLRQPSGTEMMKGAGPYFFDDDVFYVYEPRLDLLSNKELLVLDSSTWRFSLDMAGGKSTKSSVRNVLKIFDDVPGLPSLSLIQGYIESAVVCTNPAFNGRGFNITVPA